jgi:hypothetical protein
MYLSTADAALFYKLMFGLQFYVSQQLKLQPTIKSQEAYNKLDQPAKLAVRAALYEQPALIDAFVKKNPANLPDTELAIVASWQGFIAGDFFIERYLKKYSIWIGGESTTKVYGVLGITHSIEDVLHRSYLPMRVKSVLLPFKGQIIYDGLLSTYNVIFGSGIKASLREEYLAAKQNGRIVESLDAPVALPSAKKAKPARDWRTEVEAIVKLTSQLKGQNAPIQTEAFSLLKAAAELAQAAVQAPDDLAEVERQQKKVQRALRKLETALERAE